MDSDKWIIGSRDLVSFVSKSVDGSIDYSLGFQARSIITYTDFGYMTAALWRPKRLHIGIPVGSIPKLPFPKNILPALKYVAGLPSYISYISTLKSRTTRLSTMSRQASLWIGRITTWSGAISMNSNTYTTRKKKVSVCKQF